MPKKKESESNKHFSFEDFEKDMEEFRSTSFWTYLSRCDQESIDRKIRTNIIYPVKNLFKDLKWWFLHRTTHRYHVVSTGLSPGYYDTDHLMLHACFNLLKDFVEKELNGVKSLEYWAGVSDWKKAGFHSKKELTRLQQKYKECKDLYLWWTTIRSNRKPGGWEKEIEDNKEDEKMLIRLMKVRQTLWT